MAAPGPFLPAQAPSLTYASAHHFLMDNLRQAWPESKALRTASILTGMLAFGTDIAVQRHYSRLQQDPPGEDLHHRLADLYRREADRMAGSFSASSAQAQSTAGAQSVVNVHVGLPTSRYLMEEGSTDRNTDCYSCATAHLAGMEGALQRARHAAEREGGCGAECQRWLHLAAQEPSALLARDWTDERVARYPREQQEMIGRLIPRIRTVQQQILGDAQSQAILDAAVELKEASRFTASGDPLEHPEVDRRIAAAEEDLVVGERLRVGAFDPQTASQIRRLRQAVGSDLVSHEKLVEVADQADTVALAAAAPAYQRLRPEDLQAMAEQVHALREEFRQDRRRLGRQTFNALRAPEWSVPVAPPGAARVSPSTIERFTLPTAGDVVAVTDPTSIAEMADNLTRHLEERGTRVVTRNLEAGDEGSLEGFYDPDTQNITLSTAVGLQHTPYSLEVRIHEASHALSDSAQCNPRPSPSHDREEERADLATVAAMTNLGLPIELHDGTILPPGSRQVDWAHIERFDPGLARDARWAADWITAAARDQNGHLALETCPALRG